MKKAYINIPDKQCTASEYNVVIEYMNGEIENKRINQYSYSDIFDYIKESHEDERDRAVKSINITFIR